MERDSIDDAYPDAAVRTPVFGPDRRGLITYLIIEDLRRVDILKVLWLGRRAATVRTRDQ